MPKKSLELYLLIVCAIVVALGDTQRLNFTISIAAKDESIPKSKQLNGLFPRPVQLDPCNDC
jgi:hypothetical protein